MLFENCVSMTVLMSELPDSSPPVASRGSHDPAKVVFSVHTCNFTPRILLSPSAAQSQYARPATQPPPRLCWPVLPGNPSSVSSVCSGDREYVLHYLMLLLV